MYHSKLKVAVVLTAALAIPIGAASAQIEEIIVTAQKRAKSIQDVPISIIAFSGDFLEDNEVRDLQGLSGYIPNFQIFTAGGPVNTTVAIRGVGSTGSNAIEPSVGVFIDGIYYPRAGSILGNLSDIQSVEILRGPQGTLFGRNTPVGALNITTRAPQEGFSLDGSFGYATFDEVNGRATLNAGSEILAARLTAGASHRDAWAINRFDGNEIFGRDENYVRAKVRFSPEGNWEATLTADYTSIESGGNMIDLDGSENTAPTAPLLDFLSTTYGNGLPYGENDSTDYDLNQVHLDNINDEQWGVGLDLNWDIGGFQVRSITAYRDWEHTHFEDPIRLPAEFLLRETVYANQTSSQEIQLISPGGEAFEYVVGGFYYHEEYQIDRDMDLGSDGCAVLVDVGVLPPPPAPHLALCLNALGLSNSAFIQELDSYAVFGQGTYHFNEQFQVTGGLRWTRDEKSASFDLVNTGSIVGPAFRAAESHEMADSWDKVTWLANASYFLNEDVMFFATVSSGFKSGGMNSDGVGPPALTTDQRLFEPEEVLDYELGVKSTQADGRIVANVTLFRTELGDFQNRSFDGLSFVVLNAGDLLMQGVEAEIQTQPTEHLSLTFAGAYLNTEFESFVNASGLPGGPPQDLTGEGRHGSPEVTFSSSAMWEDQVANTDLSWFLGADIQYTDDQLATDNLNPQSRIDSFTLINFRLGLRGPEDQWQVSLYGRNIADQDHCLARYNQPIAGTFGLTDAVLNRDPIRCTLSEPRVLGVQFTMSY